jgi:hypothetical protein
MAAAFAGSRTRESAVVTYAAQSSLATIPQLNLKLLGKAIAWVSGNVVPAETSAT